jgi:hypothetical protein
MTTLDDRSVRWAYVEIETGTRFSLIPTRTPIIVAPQSSESPCEFCVLQERVAMRNPIRNAGVTCMSMPQCDDKVFLQDTPESKAAYTAWRLTK